MVRVSQVLRALRNIIWRNPTHHFTDGRRPEAELAVKHHYAAKKLESRGVETAEIKSTFHGGDKDPKEHITVEFKDKDGNHVTTHHVRGPRDNLPRET